MGGRAPGSKRADEYPDEARPHEWREPGPQPSVRCRRSGRARARIARGVGRRRRAASGAGRRSRSSVAGSAVKATALQRRRAVALIYNTSATGRQRCDRCLFDVPGIRSHLHRSYKPRAPTARRHPTVPRRRVVGNGASCRQRAAGSRRPALYTAHGAGRGHHDATSLDVAKTRMSSGPAVRGSLRSSPRAIAGRGSARSRAPQRPIGLPMDPETRSFQTAIGRAGDSAQRTPAARRIAHGARGRGGMSPRPRACARATVSRQAPARRRGAARLRATASRLFGTQKGR
jgi:hypothetical protein